MILCTGQPKLTFTDSVTDSTSRPSDGSLWPNLRHNYTGTYFCNITTATINYRLHKATSCALSTPMMMSSLCCRHLKEPSICQQGLTRTQWGPQRTVSTKYHKPLSCCTLQQKQRCETSTGETLCVTLSCCTLQQKSTVKPLQV